MSAVAGTLSLLHIEYVMYDNVYHFAFVCITVYFVAVASDALTL